MNNTYTAPYRPGIKAVFIRRYASMCSFGFSVGFFVYCDGPSTGMYIHTAARARATLALHAWMLGGYENRPILIDIDKAYSQSDNEGILHIVLLCYTSRKGTVKVFPVISLW